MKLEFVSSFDAKNNPFLEQTPTIEMVFLIKNYKIEKITNHEKNHCNITPITLKRVNRSNFQEDYKVNKTKSYSKHLHHH